jgi:hypothetical protein
MDGLRRMSGRSLSSALNLAPALGCKEAKGKTVSSNTTSRDI